MTECAGCGDCCENLPMNTPERADIYGKRMLASPVAAKVDGVTRKQWAWMAQLVPLGLIRITEKGEPRYRYDCPRFDKATRRCTDYANRSPVCNRYPHYDREPKPYDGGDMSPRCSFNADHRTMLPIVAVT